MGLKEKKRMRKMVLFTFILLQRKKEKKGLKEKKMMERMKKWNLGNEVMDLPMGVRVFIKIGNEYSGIYTMGNEYNEINRNANTNYKNLI